MNDQRNEEVDKCQHFYFSVMLSRPLPDEKMQQKFVEKNQIQSFVSGGLICEISTLKAYNFQTVWRKNPKISLKNQEFIGDSV